MSGVQGNGGIWRYLLGHCGITPLVCGIYGKGDRRVQLKAPCLESMAKKTHKCQKTTDRWQGAKKNSSNLLKAGLEIAERPTNKAIKFLEAL